MKGALLALKQKVSGYSKRSNDPDLKAPPPAVFNQLMDVVQVGGVNNPFKHLDVQKRNKLLLDVMRETGMRSGEVLALKLEDIDYLIHTIEVVRRHDDVSDTRKRQPVAKTLGRELKISKELVYQLREYIMTIRSKIDGANKHSFVFVTHKKGKYSGQPLSDASFRLRILRPATLTFPDLFTEINRHGFRHNFNYILSQKIDAHNKAAETDPKIKTINQKEEAQIRKRLNGWLSNDTAYAYNLRHIKEKANELMLEDMQRQASFTKKGVN